MRARYGNESVGYSLHLVHRSDILPKLGHSGNRTHHTVLYVTIPTSVNRQFVPGRVVNLFCR